jgi:DNA-binding MarR family transcriptional regulator
MAKNPMGWKAGCDESMTKNDGDIILLLLRYSAFLNMRMIDYRVLLYLISEIKMDVYTKISQIKISDDLNMTKSDVSKAIIKLTKLKLIEPQIDQTRWRRYIRFYPYTIKELSDLIMTNRENGEDDWDEKEK